MNILRRWFGSKAKAAPQVVPLSTFDAAQTHAQNYRHWMNADGLSPNASASPEFRKVLRERARYESCNDATLNGLTKTIANDLIGTGPRLRLLAPDAPIEDVRLVEKAHAKWSRESGRGVKLRVMAEARPVDGEAFALLTTNPRLRGPVKLDLRPFEADLVTDPWTRLAGDEGNWDDGIEHDASGNPTRYTILKAYPNDPYTVDRSTGYDLVDAANVLHWFRAYRPGQRRGVSDFAASLNIISQLRRHGAAVLLKEEFAANIAGVLYTNGHVDEAVALTPLDKVRLEMGTLMTAPHGWKADQFRGGDSTTNYKEFVDGKRAEFARPTGTPRNLVTGDSSGFNFSSGRLDHIPYWRQVWIDREAMRPTVLDPLDAAWLREFSALGLLPESLGPVDDLEWDYQWDGFNSIDPLKDAQASELRLRLGLTTLDEECAAEGRNWRDVLEQQAVEKRLRDELGLTPVAPPAPAAPVVADDEDPDADPADDDETDDTELDRPAARRERAYA